MSGLLTDLAHALDPQRGTAYAPHRASPAALAARHQADWVDAAHTTFLNDHLVRVASTPGQRLIVAMPPRHGKSTLTSRYLPAWYIGTYPTRKVILASYEADFASSWGRGVRDILEEHGADLFGIRIRRDSTAANRWDVEGHGGGMITAGVGGPITGRGANLLLIDDPVKNAEQAASRTYRERVWEWWLSTAFTRLEPGASAVVVMTRWHEDDLAGRLLANPEQGGGPWTLVALPALAGAGDALGRAAGEPLWPARYGAEALAEIRRSVGSYWWSALYQQAPQPAGGGLFKREHFRTYRADRDGDGAERYTLETPAGRQVVPAKECVRFATMDPAASTKTSADYTVLAAWALTPQRDLLLLDVVRQRLEGPDQPEMMRRAMEKHGLAYIAVERVAYQLTLLQAARRAGLPVRELRADTDKVSRALTAAARYEAGAVYHPRSASWLAEWEDELLAFPKGEHDDQVDTVAYAAIQVSRGAGSAAEHGESDLVWQ